MEFAQYIVAFMKAFSKRFALKDKIGIPNRTRNEKRRATTKEQSIKQK